MICQCCEERESHPLCGDYCEACARPTVCEDCERIELSESDTWEWSPTNPCRCKCESCRAADEQVAAMQALADRAIGDAESRGWSLDHVNCARSGSWYFTFSREARHLKLRVADHGTAYCTEDISLCLDGCDSGDDHNYGDWLAALDNPIDSSGDRQPSTEGARATAG